MLIALTGCDGAGKSTQANMLLQWLERRGWQSQVVDRWQILDPGMFPECRFIRASREEVRECNTDMEGLSRAMFLFWTLSMTMQKLDPQDPSRIYLLDGYWMKHAAAELEFGCDSAWIEATIRCFPPADLTIYLDVLPEEALQRRPVPTPYECGRNSGLNAGDFIRHQSKLRNRLRGWVDQFGWKVISSMQDPSLVTEQIGSYFLKHAYSLREIVAERNPNLTSER
jgi:dTMP kinase